MAQFPSTSAADGIWTLKKVRRAILGDNWPPLVPPDEFFANTVLLLNADGASNAGQNNTFLDSSSNAHTITRNGNATQGSFSPFSVDDGKWGVYFVDNQDSLSAPVTAPGTGDFTVEAWVRFDTLSGNQIIFSFGSYNPSIYYRSGSNELAVYHSSAFYLSGFTPVVNTWYHIAFTRNGTDSRLFVNGVQQGSTTSYSTDISSTTFNIGYDGVDRFGGYLSNVRYVRGTALYTSGFTPSTTPLTAVSGTELLTCQSNRFVDKSSSAHSITVTGTPKVVPFSPFPQTTAYDASTNGGSGYMDVIGDYLSVANSADFRLGSGEFTIECWVNFFDTTTHPEAFAIGLYGSQASRRSWLLSRNGSGIRFRYSADGGAATEFVGNVTLANNAWYHIAVTRDSSSDTRFFVNGALTNTANITTSFYDNTVDPLLIGDTGAASVYAFNGYIADARVIKGTAVYTSAFTPPTSPLTEVSGTSLLCNFTNASIYDATGKNVVETVGNAQVDTTTVKYGTGAMEFDGTGDYLFSTPSEQFDFGSGDFTVEFWFNSNDISAFQTAISLFNNSGWVVRFNASKIAFVPYISGVYQFILGDISTLSSNTWYHIAVTRNGNDFKLFINGTLEDSKTGSFTIPSGQLLNVGRWNGYTNRDFSGYIDDLRITKGIARYTANFTPPTAELPVIGEV